MKTLTLLSLSLLIYTSLSFCYPNVIFHGVDDTCNDSYAQPIGNLTGAYTTCIIIGTDQYTTSWHVPLEDQGRDACSQINNDPNLNGTFNVIGLSQGGLIARYIVEKCNYTGRVSKFLSIAGPQMGVNSVPSFVGNTLKDNIVNGFVRLVIYLEIIQENVAPAGYFKNMKNYQQYLNSASFLPDLNNERTNSHNITYKQRIEELDGMLLVMFYNDTVLDPPQTAWFAYYNEDGEIIDMEDQELYQDDWIGIKTLNEEGKLKRVALMGDHLQFTYEDLEDIFVPFLMN